MNVPKIFWVALAVFQIAFGSLVFLVTRSYYIDQGAPFVASPDFSPDAIGGTALTSQQPAVDLDAPRSVEEIAQLADQHFSARQYEAAAALYEQLVASDRSNVDLLNNLAITLHYVGRSEEALALIDEGIALNSDHQRIWLTRGFIMSELGDKEAATAALTTAIAIDDASEIGESARRMLSDISVR